MLAEKQGTIFFRFKSEKNQQQLHFQGDVIQVGSVKQKIDENRPGKKAQGESFKRQIHYDYNLYESSTMRKLTNELELLPSNSNIVIERVPIAFADVTYYSGPQNTLDYKGMKQSLKKQMASQQIQIHDVPKPVQNVQQKQEEIQDQIPQQEEDQLAQITKNGIKAYFTWEEFLQSLDKARFFVIRSSNFENIQISRTYGEWATLKVNEGKLNEAFNNSPHVYLIFSVSKKDEFKGFARMSTASSKQSGHWKNTESIWLGGCFQVQWITTASLPFQKIKNLTNSFQNNDLVKNSRDCTELDQWSGKEVCRLFEIPYRDPSIPPDSFIIKANSQMNVSANQVAMQQVNYIDKTRLQEIEQQKALFSYSQRPLINSLIQSNPQLLIQLSQINDEEFQGLVSYLSEKIKERLANKEEPKMHKKISK